MRIISLLVYLIFVSSINAADYSDYLQCDLSSEKRISYKDAKQTLRAGNLEQAANMFCVLSRLGDDRAQFYYSKYLFENINDESGLIVSLAYAASANTIYKSPKKEKLLNSLLGIYSLKSIDDNHEALRLYFFIVDRFGTGNRMENTKGLSKKELMEVLKKQKEKVKCTGSRVKREDCSDFNL